VPIFTLFPYTTLFRSVSTKVLTPFQAVLWAALFNFVAFFIFKDHGVANTISKTVKSEFITLPVVFAGLIAAIGWNLLTWWFGIRSEEHTSELQSLRHL